MLARLQDGRGPATATEVADALGLHVNTARFHLEALAESGLASRQREDRVVPGRPKVRYLSASDAPPAGRRSYRLLAEILAAHLDATATDPERPAIEAGERFGRLAARSSLDNRPETPETPEIPGVREARLEDATRVVVETLSAMGFPSVATTEPTGIRLDIGQCPFLELAEARRPGPGHLGVVCAVHRGLMQGLLDESDSALRVGSLEPLVAPDHCIARLVRRPPTAGPRQEAISR